MTMTFASLETSGDACAGNYRQCSQSKDQFVKNEQHKGRAQDVVHVGIPTKTINQLEAPVSWVWGATCTAASFVAAVAVAAVATPCILAIGTAGTVAAVAKRLAHQVADLADQRRTAVMSADEEIASQSRQQQHVLMLEESIHALNAELRVKDLQMTRLIEEHQKVVRELHAGVEAGISELRDAHETQLFLALEELATTSVQVEQLLRQEVEVLKAHALQVESNAFAYVSNVTKEYGDAMMQVEAEKNMLIQQVDSLNQQLSTFVALAQAFADEATDLRVNGVETASCTLHALLVAIGAPLTEALSVSSCWTLSPTESATSRGLILDLVPCIVELLSSTGPWGQKLMQFCGVARVQALEEIMSFEGRSLLRAAKVGAWEEGQRTLYCQEEVLGGHQQKRTTTTLMRLMIEQA